MNADELLLSALRGAPTLWPGSTDPELEERFLTLSRDHGVEPLLHHLLGEGGIGSPCPPSVRDRIARARIAQAALDMCRQPELTRVLAALVNAGVAVLLMKGGALAYTIYPSPDLRPRCDTDLLIGRQHLDRATAALQRIGYMEVVGVTGELVSHQRMFVKRDAGGLPHVLDVHWRVVNPHRYASTLTFEALARDSIPVPALGPAARAPGTIHALLLACLHRFAHHYEKNRLIWLYDIHLLGRSMSEADWDKALRLAEESGIAPLCARAIQAARDRLGTPLPAPAAAACESAAHRETITVPEQRWQILLSDLRALPGWRSRLRLLAEHAFPSPEYVAKKYGRNSRWLLPVYYLRRVVAGSRKLTQPVEPERAAKASR